MTLGEKIYELRTANRMSQGDLANTLEVSRQSVSKWETGSSVPELDKLVRMSEVFHISLDELVHGTVPEEPDAEPGMSHAPNQKSGLLPRTIVGLIVLGIGLILFLLLSFIAGPQAALFLSLPLFVCAGICFVVKKHAALWCGWVLYGLMSAYLRYATGIRFWWVFRGWLYRSGLEVHALIAWALTVALVVLAAVTGRLLYKKFKT